MKKRKKDINSNDNTENEFKSITKEDKVKFINPITIDSVFLRILTIGFILIVITFLVLYWTWDVSMLHLIGVMVLIEFIYLFLAFIILSLELKFVLKNTDVPNKIILNKVEMAKVLKFREGFLYDVDTN